MIIAFDSKKLREICEDDAVAVKELGSPAAEALRQRLADLRAAESIRDLLVGNPRTSGAENATLTIDLTAAARTIWSQNHTTPPRTSLGDIDWERTGRVRLVEIAKA